jgi:hypothetical protein
MSKSLAFNKSTTSTVNTVASIDSIIDSSGSSLDTIIASLVNANTTEDMLLQNAPSLSGNNTFTGTTNTFNGPIQYGSSIGVGNLSNSKHLVSKEYVDGGLTGLLSSTNTFTATNTFNNPVLYNSSIGVGNLNNSKHLVSKEYVDGGLNGLLATNNTWSGTNTFNGGALQLGKSDNSTVVAVAGAVTVPSGGSLTVNSGTTCNGGLTVANAFTASSSGISLSSVPTLQGNYSQPIGNSLATKTYVDGLMPALPDMITFGLTTTVRASGGNYIVETPSLGSSVASNSIGTYFSFYINFPQTSSNGQPTYTVLQNCVTFDLNYWLYQNLSMTGSLSSGAGQATFSGSKTNANLPNAIGSIGLINVNAKFHVSIRNGALLVYAPMQPVAIWNNPSTTSNAQSPIQFTNSYGSGNNQMKYYPIQFAYVNDQKIQVTVGYPNQDNNPTKAYWISNLGFTAQLRGSMPGTTNNFPQGTPLTVPNAGTNTNSGAAWITTS